MIAYCKPEIEKIINEQIEISKNSRPYNYSEGCKAIEGKLQQIKEISECEQVNDDELQNQLIELSAIALHFAYNLRKKTNETGYINPEDMIRTPLPVYVGSHQEKIKNLIAEIQMVSSYDIEFSKDEKTVLNFLISKLLLKINRL